MSKKILVTGSCGYIGSHTCVELQASGYELVGVDNFSNSKQSVIDQIEKITGKPIKFYEGDILEGDLLEKIFSENQIDSVIDFAAYKAVGESVVKPLEYYTNNISTLLNLLTYMQKHQVKKIIFSSSATVYGNQKIMPITEEAKTGDTTNPYGTSKLFAEKILQDLYAANQDWNVSILRYFNPVGAHQSGLIGEEPSGKPTNLMPFIVNVALGNYEQVTIFGDDYDTIDGTGVRDYIHIVDLAKAHVKALDKIIDKNGGLDIYNLGTGQPQSVKQLIDTFQSVNQVVIKNEVGPRRPGDVAVAYADPSKAEQELDWKAELNVEDMCRDAYRFALENLS